uniref:RNA-directed RNA polymerase n=1 Tax=Exserohilum turcicum mymonavirus 1 TaxID=3229033 RepID=A0AAU7YAS9_9MONO
MEDDFDFLRPNKVFFLDTNLSSPVLDVEIEATRKLILGHRAVVTNSEEAKTYKYRFKDEISEFRKLCKHRGWKSSMLIEVKQLTPDLYPLFERLALIVPEGFRSNYEEARSIAKELEQAVADGLEARGLPRESIEGTADTLGHPTVLPYRAAYEQFCNTYGRAESRTASSENRWSFGAIGQAKVWINPKYAMIELDSTLYYSSANQVLMLKDKLATRYMFLEHVLPLRVGDGLFSHLLALFRWQDDTLEKFGNQAYDLLKAVEPMFKTRLSHVTDDVFGDDTAYTRMKQKMHKKEEKVIRVTGVNYRAMEKLYTIVESVTRLDHLVEMFGCLKSSGHPIIDPRRGGLSAAHEARTPDTTSYKDALELRNVFCHIILTSYIEKKGRWPEIRFTKAGTTLQVLHARQERDITYRSYPLEDWTFVEWGKLFEMDYFPNFLELMDDKSISYYRSEKHLTWDEGVPSSQRRLLLEILTAETIDIKSVVEKVSRREIPFEWFIISLYPKEREFKIDPRMFAMMCWQMRAFFTCIEANIADNLFKYMPQQTMTKSKTQIQQRFLAFTDPSRDKHNHTLFLEIDLERWNLKWRELTVHMLGHDLNNMFGVAGTFTVTHWFFKQCQMLVRVGGLRPDGIEQRYPPETALAWRDHKGGLEGINQKLWSAATYAMIENALRQLMLEGVVGSYELCGQGDNQVLRLSIPRTDRSREETLREARDKVNTALEKGCAAVGQVVKAEENIESTKVLTYSKDVYIEGVEYPTTLKKHSRLFPVTASDFPSTTAKALAIMAGSVAGAENSRHPLCSAVVGWYHTARYLLSVSDGYSIHGRKSPKYTREKVLAALILPPSIGGMIGTPIASFMYKGGSDPLGKEISSTRLIAESRGYCGIIAGRALRGLEERYCFSPDPNLEVLIDNPYGLPIDKKTSPLGQVSHLTLEAFRGKVVNRDIKPLLDKSVESAESLLKQDILSIRPLNPILAHDLFEASGFGSIKEIRKMFLNTRTVQAVAQWVNPNITHNFLRADLNDQKWFFDWLQGLPKLSYSCSSSYVICHNARKTWGTELHGVSSYQPLDYYHRSNSVRDPSSIKWSSHAGKDLLYSRGSMPGFLGTDTTNKRSEHGYKIVDSGAPSRAMMKLQTIRSQANGNRELNELLDRIGLTRTNCKLSWISDVLSKVIGGSLSHKLVSVVRSMSASYVGPLNFITHIRLDTDSFGKVSGGSDNFNVFMQEFMVLCLAEAKLLYYHKGVTHGELVVDTASMIPIPDDALVAAEPKFKTASLPKSKLLYTPDLLLQRTYDNSVRVVPRGSIVPSTSYPTIECIEQGFIGFFVELLRDQNRAKMIADTRGLVAIPSKYRIDIAEAHSFGLKRLTKCMAQAIWISNLRDTYRTLHLHPERWDEALYLTHNIMACVKTCASYLRHPLCWTHPDSQSLRGSDLRYSSSFSTLNRVAAQVKRGIVQISRNVHHRFWLSDVPVFSSENSMSIVESLSVAAIKRVYPLFMSSHPMARQFSSLLASYTRLSVKTVLSPEQQLETLRLRLTKLAMVYKKAGDISLHDDMMRLSHLRGVAVYQDDVKTLMRYARNLEVAVGTPRPRRPRISGLAPLEGYDVCPSCLSPPVSKYEAIWRKNRIRKHGGISAAGYTWAPILGSLRVLRQVLIIGSGNGGLADILLSAFDCEVIGIDLESDMPKDSATLMGYLPVGIQSGNSQRYTQSDLSINTSGDWFDPAVRSQILEAALPQTTLFIDITSSSDLLEETIHHAFSYQQIDTISFRLIGSADMFALIRDNLNRRYSSRAWLSSRSYHEVECLFEVRRDPNQFLHRCNNGAWLCDMISENVHSLIPPRTQELVEAATFSSIGGQPIESLYEISEELDAICKSLLNKNKNRQLLYKDRMSLIWGHITVYLARCEDSVAMLQEWISDEMIETNLLKYPIKESIVTHLLRYVPRLRSVLPQ